MQLYSYCTTGWNTVVFDCTCNTQNSLLLLPTSLTCIASCAIIILPGPCRVAFVFEGDSFSCCSNLWAGSVSVTNHTYSTHLSHLQSFHLSKTTLTLLGPHSSTCVSGLWRLLQSQYHRRHFFLTCHFEPTFVANVDLLVQILTFDHLYGSLV